MKKLFTILLLLSIILPLAISCSRTSDEDRAEEKKVDDLLKRDQERADSFKRAMDIQN